MLDCLMLCLVTNRGQLDFDAYKALILKAIQGGVTSVQWRDKLASVVESLEMARELKRLLTPLGVPLIINDHVDIANAVDADGVHLGQSDGDLEKARALLGPDKLIGLSIESMDDLARANVISCIDYVAASAVFPSQTKADCVTYWGLDGLSRMVAHSSHPVVGIGGINRYNVQQVMACGVLGVAVVDAIHAASCPKHAARSLIDAMHPSQA